jgi:hypothetical protein
MISVTFLIWCAQFYDLRNEILGLKNNKITSVTVINGQLLNGKPNLRVTASVEDELQLEALKAEINTTLDKFNAHMST